MLTMQRGSDSEDEDFKPKPKRTTSQSSSQPSTSAKRPRKRLSSKPKKEMLTSSSSTDNPESVGQSTTVPNKNTEGFAENVEDSFVKNDGKTKSDTLGFCPICQVPLSILKISPEMHTAACNISGNMPACVDGIKCLNCNIFHYRDYSHHELAAFRDSNDYFEPNVIFTPKSSRKKKSPVKSSVKKRPSKSPAQSPLASKSIKKDELFDSKELPSTSSGPAEAKKRLPFDDYLSDDNMKDCLEQSLDDPPSAMANYSVPDSVSKVEGEQHSEVYDKFELSEVWCSDLILSAEAPHPASSPETVNESRVESTAATVTVTENIKGELESESNVETLSDSASNAKVIIEYCDVAPTGSEQRVEGVAMKCTDDCPPSESEESLQANCSVVFKGKGLHRAEIMARSPVSVTLLVNSSGWEAVEIKSIRSTDIQKVQISLCECGHSVCVDCSVSNRDIFRDVKFQKQNYEQHEKFFATMSDLGLKNQLLYYDPTERKKYLTNSCNQVTISSLCKEETMPMHANDENVTSDKVSLHEFESKDAASEEQHESKQTVKVVDAFALLKNNSKNRKNKHSDTTSVLSSGSTSRPPTPVPMVVSNTTSSSWTLVPAAGKLSTTAVRAQTTFSKKVPAYKRIPDTQFVVDAFNYGIIPGVRAFFLSHFHSDHYQGLNKKFSKPIYCSKITANLAILKLGVNRELLHVLKVGEPQVVCGVEIDVFDAYHCPGAIMFLFRLLDGRVFLHVGDFRAQPSMEGFPQLKHVDKLYLDTTYCNPSYDFPSQDEVVSKVVKTVQEHLVKNKSTLIVCGTYTIGKEKVFQGVAEAFDFKIWTTGEKRKVLNCLEDQKLNTRLTTDPLEAQVHVMYMRDIALEELLKHLAKYNSKYSHVVGFKPTGWTTSSSLNSKPSDFQKSTRGKATIYGVPYSEHSSYSELRRFVRYVKPKDIQVTVNVGNSAKYRQMFQQWLSNSRDGNGQSKMIQYFEKNSSEL